MKLVLCYTVFNGLELLEKSISSMYEHVDEILICYQSTSNKGEFNSEVEPFVQYLERKYNKITLSYFYPTFPLSTKQQERIKHTNMMKDARMLGATHYIIAACDHFYTHEDIVRTKQIVIDNDIDVTLTRMKTYYKKPTWMIEPMEEYYMPFISKMYPNTKYINENRSFYPVTVDPSVMVNTCEKILVMNPDECILHHFSMIREDIENKFRNAAASIRWNAKQIETFINEYKNAKPGDEISYFQKRKLVECDNLFNI